MMEYNVSDEKVKNLAFSLEQEECLKNQLKSDLKEMQKEIEKVKSENKETIKNMVITMYKSNIDIETISKVSNLSLEEIKNIINK